MDQALDMAKIAYEALDEKKGEAIKVIDISQISVIADYFDRLAFFLVKCFIIDFSHV